MATLVMGTRFSISHTIAEETYSSISALGVLNLPRLFGDQFLSTNNIAMLISTGLSYDYFLGHLEETKISNKQSQVYPRVRVDILYRLSDTFSLNVSLQKALGINRGRFPVIAGGLSINLGGKVHGDWLTSNNNL